MDDMSPHLYLVPLMGMDEIPEAARNLEDCAARRLFPACQPAERSGATCLGRSVFQ